MTTCHHELPAVHKHVFFVCAADNFTDAAVSGKINGEHKEKDLEPWDGGETHNSDSLESLDTDVVRKQDPTNGLMLIEHRPSQGGVWVEDFHLTYRGKPWVVSSDPQY